MIVLIDKTRNLKKKIVKKLFFRHHVMSNVKNIDSKTKMPRGWGGSRNGKTTTKNEQSIVKKIDCNN